MTRLRLLPVLVFGLVSLLSIKLLSLALNAPPEGYFPQRDASGGAFARAITLAREGNLEDQIVTGSTGKKAEPKADEPKKEVTRKTEEEKAADAKARVEFNNKAEPEGAKVISPNTQIAGQAPASAQEKALLEKLKDRRGEIDARDRDLELRDNLLKMSERKLDERIGELRSLENQAGQSAGKNDPKSRYKSLVVMYESMKPKEAARIFDRLDVRVLLDLVGHMNPRKMSEILAVMDPSAAEKLTLALARQASQGDTQVAEGGQADTELQRLPTPGAPRR